MNVAIFTPSQNPYSETFIQAHKYFLKDKVFYYYGSGTQVRLEGTADYRKLDKIFFLKIKRKLLRKPYSFIHEQLMIDSLKENNIDVVLAEYGTHAHHILPAIKKTGLPLVVHFHGYDASIKTVIHNHNNYKAVFEYASKVIAVSKVMAEKLLSFGCPKDKIIYNVYGPWPEFQQVVPTYFKKQFIGIGRFTDKKAPYYTLLAFAQIAKNHSDATLILAGDGVLLNMCQNLAKHLQIEKQVSFPGVITPEAYRELLSESLAFVQHSITASSGDMEGTPLAVLEASAAGLPVISTKHAGIPDVIIDGKTGLLCEEHDVILMANHMNDLLSDVEKAKKMGAAGKKHIEKNFSMERHITVLQKVLEDTSNSKK